MMNQTAAMDGAAVVDSLLKGVEHEAGMGGATDPPAHDPAGHHRPRPSLPSRSGYRPNSRSSGKPKPRPPSATDTPRHARAPSEPHGSAPRGKLVRCLAHQALSYLGVRASDSPGAVQISKNYSATQYNAVLAPADAKASGYFSLGPSLRISWSVNTAILHALPFPVARDT